MRPELWRSLASLMDALEPPGESALRLSGVTLEMPLELALRRAGDEVLLLGSLPRWRWSTAFDDRPARMRVEMVPERPIEVLPDPDAVGGDGSGVAPRDAPREVSAAAPTRARGGDDGAGGPPPNSSAAEGEA